jgi:microcystin-dependent protein
MAWGRFKTFIREYLTFQTMNRLQDDLYTKLNFLNDNKVNFSMVASKGEPSKLVKADSTGTLVCNIAGNATTADNGVPIGLIAYFPFEAIPGGWLECDGSEVSRETYSLLFAAIGTLYGAGDGAVTFNLPELRGEFIRGWSHGRADVDADRKLGSAQEAVFEKHTHKLKFVTDDGGLWHYSQDGVTGASYSDSKTKPLPESPIPVEEVGGDETRPRNIAMIPCIFGGIGNKATGGAVKFDHSVLANLLADDHPQYLNLKGREDGQTVTDNLTLQGDLTITDQRQDKFLKALPEQRGLELRGKGSPDDPEFAPGYLVADNVFAKKVSITQSPEYEYPLGRFSINTDLDGNVAFEIWDWGKEELPS